MIKKLLATTMSMIMIMTLLCVVPVSADTSNPYIDHVPNEETRYSNNMVTAGTTGVVGDAWGGSFTYGFNGAGGAGGIQYGLQSGTEYYFKNLSDVNSIINNDYPVVGFNVRDTDPENATGRVVYSMKLRANASPKAVINAVRLNVSYAATSTRHVEYPVEYNGNDQGIIPGTGSTTFVGTFADTGSPVAQYRYRFGFVKGTEANAVAYFDAASVYFGYEYAYDISVKADGEVPESPIKIVPGETINVDADIFNQVGLTGGLSQDVTWQLMNTDRTETYTTGIEITPAADGTAQIQIDPYTVPAGEYDIVAYSASYGIAKGVRVSVPEVVSKLTLSGFSNGKVIATAEIANKTANPISGVMVVVMVNDKNQIKDIATVPVVITSTNVKETYTKELTATDISKVTKAKAFFIDCGSEASPTVLNSNMNEIAASVVVSK